jgi:hypothetical protein
MNQQKAPVYQEQQKAPKKPRPRGEDLSKVERESVEELMREMERDNSYDDDDDIIDAENDPSVEVTTDYGDED